MRHIIFAFCAFIVGCGHSSSSPTAATAKDPAAVTQPAVSPAPAAPAAIVWPPADAIQTSEFNSYSCSVITGLGVGCYDGTNQPYYQATPYTDSTAQVAVGNVICAVIDSAGVPDACTTNVLTDPACTANPPTNAHIACWTTEDTTPVVINVQNQVGYGTSPNYLVGPTLLEAFSNGTVCVTESVYNSTTGAYITTASQCGNSITGGLLK